MPTSTDTASARAHGRPRRILVLDGDERASLAVVRSLVRAGFEVHVLSRRTWSLAGASKGVTNHVTQLHPLDAPADYVQEIVRLASALAPALLIPVTDASAEAVLEHQRLLPSGVQLPFARREVYQAASDKIHVHRLAASLGIGCERTVVIQAHDRTLPADDAFFPAVLKPHRSVVGGATRSKTGVRFVADRASCTRALSVLPEDAFPVLLQERVMGPGEGVFLARWGGRTLARFAHRRLREKPPAGGVSVYRESAAMDPEVLAACESLLDALEWEGVAMIEGKRDLATGRWVVMEINGRFWGSLQLAIDAGVDFPALLARAVLGDAPEPIPTWREGVRLRWEWGDVDHLFIRMHRSKSRLSLPPSAPGRLAALGQFCVHRPGRDHLEILRWSDPAPFLVESLARLGFAR